MKQEKITREKKTNDVKQYITFEIARPKSIRAMASHSRIHALTIHYFQHICCCRNRFTHAFIPL